MAALDLPRRSVVEAKDAYRIGSLNHLPRKVPPTGQDDVEIATMIPSNHGGEVRGLEGGRGRGCARSHAMLEPQVEGLAARWSAEHRYATQAMHNARAMDACPKFRAPARGSRHKSDRPRDFLVEGVYRAERYHLRKIMMNVGRALGRGASHGESGYR